MTDPLPQFSSIQVVTEDPAAAGLFVPPLGPWTSLKDLKVGSLFTTTSGVRGIKLARIDSVSRQFICLHPDTADFLEPFLAGNETPVCEIDDDGKGVIPEPDESAFDNDPPQMLGHMETLTIQEGDLVVMRFTDQMKRGQKDYLRKLHQAEFPKNKVMILDNGTEIGVMRGAGK